MSLWQTTQEAFALLFSLDKELWEIVAVSFSVSLTAILLVLLPATFFVFSPRLHQFSRQVAAGFLCQYAAIGTHGGDWFAALHVPLAIRSAR